MGPRGPLSLKQRLEEEVLNGDCHRREKALTILRDKGYAEFAIHVVGGNVPLHRTGVRAHSVYRKSYLLRDEFYNDSLFVKAILDTRISAAAIIQLYEDSKVHERLSVIDYNNFTLPPNIIRLRKKGDVDPRECKGAMGLRGPGDDGYGGRCCGDGPTMRQYLNDPICILMLLFIRADRSLIDYMLEHEEKLLPYLYTVFELFLIDSEAYDELVLISDYMHHVVNCFGDITSIAKRAYPDRYTRGDFKFLDKIYHGLTYDVGDDEEFYVEAKVLDILPSKAYYTY